MVENAPRLIPEQIKTPEPYGAVLRRGDYYIDFALEASRVNQGGEVTCMAMYTEPGEDFDAIRTIFESVPRVPDESNPDKKTTSVRMNFTIDDYSRAIGPGGRINEIDRFLPGEKASVAKTSEEYEDSLNQMRDLGVDVNILNKMTTLRENVFPFTGRTHLKGSFVDNRASDNSENSNQRESVFYFQTGNIEPDRNDLFIKFTGEKAERMIDIYKEIFSDTPPENDTVFEISDDLFIVYDSGQKGKSTIRTVASEMVKGAEESVDTMSLMSPDAIAEELADAVKRGIDVQAIVSKYHFDSDNLISVDTIFWAMDLLSQAKAALARQDIPQLRDPFFWAHTKLIIVDQAIASLSSHNLSEGGIKAGTKEWQLVIKDPNIVDGLYRKFKDMKTLADDKNIEYLL